MFRSRRFITSLRSVATWFSTRIWGKSSTCRARMQRLFAPSFSVFLGRRSPAGRPRMYGKKKKSGKKGGCSACDRRGMHGHDRGGKGGGYGGGKGGGYKK